jgi:hypothetical protein
MAQARPRVYYEFNMELSSIYGQSTVVPNHSVYFTSRTHVYALSGLNCECILTAEEHCEFLGVEKWKSSISGLDFFALLIAEKGKAGHTLYWIELHTHIVQKVQLQFMPMFIKWIEHKGTLVVGSYDLNGVYSVNLSDLKVSQLTESFLQSPLSYAFVLRDIEVMGDLEIHAIGCLDGHLDLSVHNPSNNEELGRYSGQTKGAVGAVHFFVHDKLGICLLVCTTFAFAALYLDVAKQGFQQCIELPDCSDCDAITCGTSFADSGHFYIVLGTFSQQILIFNLSVLPKENDEIELKLLARIDAGDPIMNISRYPVVSSHLKYLLVHLIKGVLLLDISNHLLHI